MLALPPNLIARLARKELREILRDRRTIITLVLMPILLYPLLGMAFRYFLLTTSAPTAETMYRIATRSDLELSRLQELLDLKSDDPKFFHVPTDDLEAALRDDEADLAVAIRGADRPFNDPDLSRGYECVILRRKDSVTAINAEKFVRERLNTANEARLLLRLRGAARRRDVALPIHVEVREVTVGVEKKPSYIATLIPLVLVLMTITGAVYPAIDLTAGERERGTLEILMAAPIPRVALLLAKYVAVMTVAMLTGLVNLTMMTLTLLASGLGPSLFPEGLSLLTILAVLALLMLFAAFFSAVLLAITSFARSFKEAQAYLIPVMLLAISPGIASLMPGLKLGGLLTIAPLINVVLLARELLEGGVPPAIGVVVVLSTLLYAFAAIGVAARLFGAEAVLFSEQGQFADLFRRPREPRAAPSLNAAVLCLALAFPLTFLLNGLLGSARAWPIELKMLFLVLVFVLLFVGLPLISAYLSRVNVRSGFQLAAVSPLALSGALLLGLSLWPVILELIILQERAGFTSMPQTVRDAVKASTDQWRLSPYLVLFALAVVPGIVEEFFFRGYLFSALVSTTRPRNAIVISALLFGAFHLFPGGVLAIERLLPTTLMGLVLGLVRWRSGSLWPGMILHATHNGLLLAAALFPGAFSGVNSAIEGTGHVPGSWLTAAAAVIALGAGLVWLGSRSPAAPPSSAPE